MCYVCGLVMKTIGNFALSVLVFRCTEGQYGNVVLKDATRPPYKPVVD